MKRILPLAAFLVPIFLARLVTIAAETTKPNEEYLEGDATLLDRTTVLVTSNMGNASSHSNQDLPVLLAGGRFKHRGHPAFEANKVPLSNLYLSVLHQLGIEEPSFGTSTGLLTGLELG